LRTRHARDAAIQPIEHHRRKDAHRSQFKALVHCLHDRIETGNSAASVNRFGSQ
jgi:hypothetical protein